MLEFLSSLLHQERHMHTTFNLKKKKRGMRKESKICQASDHVPNTVPSILSILSHLVLSIGEVELFTLYR